MESDVTNSMSYLLGRIGLISYNDSFWAKLCFADAADGPVVWQLNLNLSQTCMDYGMNTKRRLFFYYREAEAYKEKGNAFYVQKDYNEAYNYYTKAIGEFDS